MLVDDQPLIRYGFGLILGGEEDMEVVGEASNGEEAVAAARDLRPDVVLMDVRMPVLDGIEATRQICAEMPGVQVVILTTFDLDEYAFEGIKAGASAFLLKDADPEELARAVRVVAEGDSVVAPRVTSRLLEEFVRGSAAGAAPADSACVSELTPREVEVLEAIASGCSNAEIASRLFVSEATVKTHVGRVLSKLGLRDRVHAVIFAYENGLVRPGGREG
ncbi:response regulator transcription factor [Falsarthrobacter nasiphocae]|nr:response regulator transcription factor [Falsarthrobacter nasiphocae]